MRGAKYFQGSNDTEANFTTASIKDSFWVGGGVGYQINNYLRTDATFDYMFKSDSTDRRQASAAALHVHRAMFQQLRATL